MKTTLLSTLTFLAISAGVNAQNVTIPDANFKAYLIGNTSINTNNDTEIQVSEASAFTGQINCSSLSISDMTGIEAFTSLTALICYNNPLTNLDVTQNTALTNLNCYLNQLSSLDVSNNTLLTTLSTSNNPLGSLDVSQNTALQELSCQNNSLTSLDITLNTSLTLLTCGGNLMSTFDLSQNTALTTLICNHSSITSLDLSQNTALTNLECTNSSLVNLDLLQNTALTIVKVQYNSIVSLDVSQNTALMELHFYDNSLSSLNVANGNNANIAIFAASGNPSLTCIQVDDVAYSTTNWVGATFAFDPQTSFSTNCGGMVCSVYIPDANFKASLVGNVSINTNGDTEIQCSEASAYTGIINCSNSSISNLTGLEAFTASTKLLCYNNSLTSLDVSNNTSLTDIDCSNNTLTSLNISININLSKLICSNNSINNLDVSNNASLTQLWCDDNSITNLDISNNTSLTRLWCHNNSLSNLNVSSNVNLTDIRCYNNSISSLNVSNCLALEKLKCGINLLTSLDVSLNPNLTDLSCADNSLTSLNAANGNNTNFSGDFGTTGFYTINNPNLTCIEVDDVAYSTTNWTDIDATSSFSTNCSLSAGINNSTVSTFKLYPNPVQNELFIDFENEQIKEINILDLSGKMVWSSTNKNIKSINVSDLSQGVYILKVHSENGVASNRFVKQ